MRRSPLIAAPLLLALALASCGGDDDVRLGAPSGPSIGPSTSTTTLDTPVSDVPIVPGTGATPPSPDRPQRVVPTNDAVDVVPMSFSPDEVKAVSGGVLVRFWGGVAPCFLLDHYTVAESAQTVTIGLFAGRAENNDDVACIEIALRYEVKVPLDAPLGDRRVVDANPN